MVNLPGKSSDFVNFGLAAAKQSEHSTIKQILKLHPDWLNRIGPHGRTMLWEAAYRGNTETVSYLLELGADPHVWGCYFTPLFVEIYAYVAAVWKRRTDTAKLLHELFQPLNLFSAAFLGDYERVKQLVEERPDRLNQEKAQHDREVAFTALHYAISGGYSKILKLLLDSGSNPEPYAYWLVRFAVWRNDPESLEVLLESGIVLHKLKWEPAFAKTPKLRDLLRRSGVAIDPNCSENRWPPLVYESRGDRGGNISHVTELLNLGADVNVQNYKGETALHCASKAGFVAITELLLHHGAHIDITDNQGLTPLQHALRSTIKSRSKRASVIQSLLRHGASVEKLSELDQRKLYT